MRRLHLVAGVVTVLAFLTSGAYMRFVAHVDALPLGPQLMYISRHIYMLGPALMHLVLSAYVRSDPPLGIVRLQWTGTAFLVLSSTLLMTAFVFEPMAGRGRTAVSAFGIFTFAAGAILHVVASRVGRARTDLEPGVAA